MHTFGKKDDSYSGKNIHQEYKYERYHQNNRSRRAKLLVPLIIGILLLGGLLFLGSHGYFRSSYGLPVNVTRQITSFDPYFLKEGFSTDFTLQPKSVSYQRGILVFTMINPVGKSLIITEQRTPVHFDPSTLVTSSQTNTEYGQEFITNDSDRTVGTLFSTDHTWIIVNAPNPIGSNAMELIIGALTPLQPK